VPVVKCKSKSNNWYYKCYRCGEFWFEDAYELFLRDNHAHLLEGSMHTPVQAVQVVQQPANAVQGLQQHIAEFKLEAVDLKLQLADIKVEMGNLKTEMKDLKDEVRKGNIRLVVDNAATVFVILVVALLVAVVLNKFM
jgi:hypothetical protein